MGDNWLIDELREEGIAIGLEKGLEKGMEKGMEKGQAKEARRAVLRILRKRFGGVPEEVRDGVERLESIERLESLLERAIDCPSLDAFQVLLVGE